MAHLHLRFAGNCVVRLAYVVAVLAVLAVTFPTLGAESAHASAYSSHPSSPVREGPPLLSEVAACGIEREGTVSTDCLLDRALNGLVMGGLTRYANERGRELFGEHFRLTNRLNWSPGGPGIGGNIDAVFPLSLDAAREFAPDGRRFESRALFFQWGVTRWTDDNGKRRDDLRYGMVRRFRLFDKPNGDVVGLSAMFQHNRERGHGRLVAGIDYAGGWGSGWLHRFMPTTGWRPGRSGFEERALGGMEVGLRVKPTTTVALESALTRWENGDGSGRRSTGVRVGASWQPHPWLTLRTAWEETRAGDDAASFGVVFSIPLGGDRRARPRWEGLGLAGGNTDTGTDAPDIWRPIENVGPLQVAERSMPVAVPVPSTTTSTTTTCQAGQTVRTGERCTYPGTALEFTVLASGSSRLGFFTGGGFFTAETRLSLVNTTINGQRITFVAGRQDDGGWLIERVGDSEVGSSDTAPGFGGTVDDRTYMMGTAIAPLTLPAATGGEGALAYALTPEVPGLSFDAATRRLSGTPTQAGVYEMTYRVSDADDNTQDTDTATLSFTITVASGDTVADTAPMLHDGIAPPTYTAGRFIPILRLPQAYGGNGALTYTLTPEVQGLSFDPATRRLSGTPAQAGAYEMTYRAGDSDANTADSDTATRTFTINVQAAGDFAPRMYSSVPFLTYTAGTAIFARTLPQAYGGNGALTYTLTPEVQGLSFDPATRRLSGTPTRAGVYEMTYRASDSDANANTSDTATRTFTITVQAAGDFALRMYGTIAPQAYTVGTAIAPLTLPQAYGGNGALTYTLTPEVPGLSFDPATRRLSGTPTQAGVYRMTYRAADSDANTADSDAAIRTFTIIVETTPVGVPDLAVGSPSVSDTSPDAGASFTLSTTVRNGGDGRSAATTLRYYRSSDATITTSDTAVGTDAVGGLAASGTSAESISLTAPPDPGTYYYGACVDAVAGESDTANNCSSSAAVTVTETRPQPRLRPDLALESAYVTPSGRLDGGQRFIFGVTVRNRGDEESLTSPTLRYYLSVDATISADDRQVGTDSVDPLAVSGRADETITLTAPSTPGAYYYGACVGAVPGESSTSNNCSSAVAVTVEGAPPSGEPDLSVQSFYANPASSLAGETFTLLARVRNRGDQEAAATTLRYYRSTDATITTSDTQVGTGSVAGLAASAHDDVLLAQTAPSDPGTYYYGACVDAVAGESDTDNNCSSSAAVTVTETRPQPRVRPDLALESAYVTPSGRLDGGQRFIFGVTVRNRGDGESLTSPTLRYYFSLDATISTGDRQVGTDSVGPLAVSGKTDEAITLTAPSTPGTYYYGACVGAVPGETSTSNNCSSAVAVTVEGASPSGGPDLSVQSFYASPASSLAGEGFVLVARVRNRGDREAASTTLRYYRSTDSTITTSDTQVGTGSVEGLAASAHDDVLLAQTAPSRLGTYYYGACVDRVAGESDTANNCSSSAAVTVIETRPQPRVRPDLALESAYVTPSRRLDGGQRFIFGVTVRNRGDGESLTSPTLRYYLSLDATISTGDRQVGTDSVGPLAVSGKTDEAITLTAPSYSGTYYYGACVGAVPAETNTSNNCSSAVAVTVSGETPPEPPDLRVQSLSATPDSLIAGQRFTLSAGAHNNGGKDAAATTLRYYRSSDSTISTSDTQVGTDAVAALKAYQGGGSESVILTAPSSPGTYYYGACLDSVSGETNTANNCSSAVAVTVRSAPSDTAAGRYGAFALSIRSCDQGGAVGLVVDMASRVAALNAARQACLDDGGRSSGCTPHLFSNQCLAVGFGVGGRPGCNLGPTHGATVAAAATRRLSFCRDRQGFTNCTIVASGCNSPTPPASSTGQ